jgi:hypothetical protein
LENVRKPIFDYLNSNDMTHEEILTALQVELNDKRMTGKEQFRPGLLRWINERRFEHYRGRTLEPVEMGYGTELF